LLQTPARADGSTVDYDRETIWVLGGTGRADTEISDGSVEYQHLDASWTSREHSTEAARGVSDAEDLLEFRFTDKANVESGACHSVRD